METPGHLAARARMETPGYPAAQARTETPGYPAAQARTETPGHPAARTQRFPPFRSSSSAPTESSNRNIRSMLEFPQKEKTLALTSALCHKQELTVSAILIDPSVEALPPGSEPPDAGKYITLTDGRLLNPEEKYQSELWSSDEGLFLTGPGLPEDGIKPVESMYGADSQYFEAYGSMRYCIEARFQLPAAPTDEKALSGYALRVLDFEQPLEFSLKSTPEYETLEELAAAEHGSLDTHDGITIISMGEQVEDGILVSWYVYDETPDCPFSIHYVPPLQEIAMSTISSGGNEYPIKQMKANPYWDNPGFYRLSDLKWDSRRFLCMFDVPADQQNTTFQVNIPGITFSGQEESTPVTLTIPDDYEELNVDIPWEEGSVRIIGIKKLQGPQTVGATDAAGELKVVDKPAVYIYVKAVHEDKDLILRGLLCERMQYGGWERGRYDYDGNGTLTGFRVFYKEGDTEVTLKFHLARFYWEQPFVMEIVPEK